MSDSDNEYQTNHFDQIDAVNDLLRREGLDQRAEDPLNGVRLPGKTDAESVQAYLDTAERIREQDSRSPSNRNNSRYSPSDEGGNIDPPAAMPSRFQTQEDVTNAANWLTNEITAVDTAYRQGLINEHQYQLALANANQLASEIYAGNLSVRENAIRQRDQLDALHGRIGELIPEWRSEEGRQKVQSQLFGLANEYGIPREILMQVSDPQAIAGMHSLFKDLQSLRTQRSRQIQKIRQREHESRRSISRESTGYTSINDQVAAASDILRSAGIF